MHHNSRSNFTGSSCRRKEAPKRVSWSPTNVARACSAGEARDSCQSFLRRTSTTSTDDPPLRCTAHSSNPISSCPPTILALLPPTSRSAQPYPVSSSSASHQPHHHQYRPHHHHQPNTASCRHTHAETSPPPRHSTVQSLA